MKNKIWVYDTTLRDGTQSEGISFSCNDKLRIAQRLDDLGVDYIEGGWPGSNPKDIEFFERIGELDLKHAKIAAFGSTRRANTAPEDDANLQAMLNANTPTCTIVGKTWTLHVTDVLQTTLEENLRMIEESMAYIRSHEREVIYDAEHFFDGYKADPDYACQTLGAAVKGGATSIVLCDTNGGVLPDEIAEITREIQSQFPETIIGIHTHNDSECAVANTLVAVNAGATHVQGTINGYGERCGNANLCSIIPDLELKMGYACLPENQLESLYDLSHFVAELANLSPNEHLPYVGRSAFAHKGGIHVAALRKNVDSYQHISPELVGNQMRTVISELSGRGNLMSKVEEFGVTVDDQETWSAVLANIKSLEARGFSFESAEASIEMMIHRQQKNYKPTFELIDYSATVEHRQGRGVFAEAMVKIKIDDEIIHTIAEGDGPVNALDKALRKGLRPIYPKLMSFQLADYKVRIIDGNHGTAAITRVLIETQNTHRRWSTVGASQNIIEASWVALIDSIEYGLKIL